MSRLNYYNYDLETECVYCGTIMKFETLAKKQAHYNRVTEFCSVDCEEAYDMQLLDKIMTEVEDDEVDDS
jgi:hypothetical protein